MNWASYAGAASVRALSLPFPGAWFVQLEFMQLLFALLTLFAVPSMYFLAWVRAPGLARPARPRLSSSTFAGCCTQRHAHARPVWRAAAALGFICDTRLAFRVT